MDKSEFRTEIIFLGSASYQVTKLPITRIEAFIYNLNVALSLMEQAKLSIAEAYAINGDSLAVIKIIKTALDNCITLSGFDGKGLSPTEKQTLLQTLQKVNDIGTNTEVENKETQESIPIWEYVDITKTLLIHCGLCANLIEAEAIADRYPSDRLNSLIKARVDQLKTPEQREKAEKEKLRESTVASFRDGGFFDDMPEFNKPLAPPSKPDA